jgi:hypothetical protein
MLLRISFFQRHKRKWRYIFAAPSDTITVVHRALQESPKARDDLLVKGDALQYANRVLDRSTIGVTNGRYITLPDKSDPNQPSACDASPTSRRVRLLPV